MDIGPFVVAAAALPALLLLCPCPPPLLLVMMHTLLDPPCVVVLPACLKGIDLPQPAWGLLSGLHVKGVGVEQL